MKNDNNIPMAVVREYGEGSIVYLGVEDPTAANGLTEPRLVVLAYNQGGHDRTAVDLVQLIDWLRSNRPELLGRPRRRGPRK